MNHIGGYAIIKTGRRRNGLTFSVCNIVNNIECYWSRSHSLSATHCLPRVLSDLFLGQCHQLPLLLPLGLHLNQLKPLSATVVALFCFISHLNIKICKLLRLKLQIKQIRVVFSHLKLWVKVVRQNSQVCENLV